MENEIAKSIVELQNLSAIWSISASIASIILAIVAIFFSIYFYTQSKKSEKDVSNSLSKIESQADALSKITNKHLDRFTKHATERKSNEDNPDFKVFLELASTITQGLTQSLSSQSSGQGESVETIKYAIGSLYYCATTNYYTYMSLPDAASYDENNYFHSTTKRLMDLTKNDVDFIINTLKNYSAQSIQATGLQHLYDEAMNIWVPKVKDSASAFAHIEQNKSDA